MSLKNMPLVVHLIQVFDRIKCVSTLHISLVNLPCIMKNFKLPPRTIAQTVSFELLGFVYSFSLFFFVSVLCARLGWRSCQLLSSR